MGSTREVTMDYVAVLVLGFFLGTMFRSEIIITKKTDKS